MGRKNGQTRGYNTLGEKNISSVLSERLDNWHFENLNQFLYY